MAEHDADLAPTNPPTTHFLTYLSPPKFAWITVVSLAGLVAAILLVEFLAHWFLPDREGFLSTVLRRSQAGAVSENLLTNKELAEALAPLKTRLETLAPIGVPAEDSNCPATLAHYYPEPESDWSAVVSGLPVEQTLRPNQPFHGRFDEAACHFLTATISETAYYKLSTGPVNRRYNSDTRLYLFDDESLLLGYNDDGGDALYSQLERRLEKGRKYGVLVSSRLFSKTGNYTLSLETMPLASKPDTAQELLPDSDQSTDGELTTERSELWYQFTVPASARYSVETSSPASGSSADTVLKVYRSKQNGLLLVDQNDDTEDESLDSAVSLRFERGQYYVRVSHAFRFSLLRGSAEGFLIRVTPDH